MAGAAEGDSSSKDTLILFGSLGLAIFAALIVAILVMAVTLGLASGISSIFSQTEIPPGAPGGSTSGNYSSGGTLDPNNQNRACQELYALLRRRNIDIQIFNQAANRWGVPVNLLIAQAQQESDFRSDAVNNDSGAQGMMQFLPSTWTEQTGGDASKSPFNPRDAAWYGAKYMRQHYDRYHDWDSALAAYNAGAGHVDDFLNGTNLAERNPRLRRTPKGIPPWTEPTNYVRNINANAARYQQCVQGGSSGGGTTTPVSGNRAELARQIKANRNITLLTTHVNRRFHPASTASGNINDTVAGRPAARSPDCRAGNTNLSENMLRATLQLAQSFSFRVVLFAGGCHSANSYHYDGRAIDIDVINGRDVDSSNPSFRAFMQKCRELGAVEVIGPPSADHDTHVHCAW